MRKAVLLVGHADQESLNYELAEHYTRGFTAAGGSVERFNLAELDFDPALRQRSPEPQPLEPGLQRVRQAIEASSHLVWVFPTYWASPPAIVRGLFDRLFLPGWAFTYEKGNPLPKGLLAGRSARVILTMDSPWFWYTFVHHRCIHRSFGTASLRFCGLKPVEFTSLHGVRSMSAATRQRWHQRAEQLGAADASKVSRRIQTQ
jgi:NAD(P)H dehydrogenase (quinone)